MVSPIDARPRLSQHTLIVLSLVAGAVAGVAVNLLVGAGRIDPDGVAWVVRYLTRPLGQIFLNMLFMVVIPLVFCSLVLGVVNLGKVGKLGRLSVKTFLYFVATTAASATLGLLLVNLFRPGAGFDPASQAQLMESFRSEA
ncbi:MAG TPA: cation:dicarboxylase symporter family transporter, partial [Vicinamibacteria bacterium]|nr:cation:dicarboxylase symporter family transporter [Vicinamibacteria bacterium]